MSIKNEAKKKEKKLRPLPPMQSAAAGFTKECHIIEIGGKKE